MRQEVLKDGNIEVERKTETWRFRDTEWHKDPKTHKLRAIEIER